jgi:phenylalanine-4-hydroxylase
MLQTRVNYSAEDHKRWSFLMRRKNYLLANANEEYLRGYELIRLGEGKVPQLEDINRALAPLTGWKYATAPENLGTADFLEALAEKVFFSSSHVRSWGEMDFCRLPDIFHDVFGHAAMLASKEFTDFLQQLGKLSRIYRHDEKIIKHLSSLFWYTAEVGLIREDGRLKYYGGSIISSTSEIETVYSPSSEIIPYSIKKVCRMNYDSYAVNSSYFVIEDLQELTESLTELENYLGKEIPELNIF